MNIYTVRDNLIRTIEGKQAYLRVLNMTILPNDETKRMANEAIKHMLQDNIAELTRILKDVAECCTIATERSWIGVDRQGGI